MTLSIPRPVPSDEISDLPGPAFTDADFRRIAEFARREFGLFLQDNKKQVVHARLIRLVQETGCRDIAAFCNRIENNPTAPEREALISALTTNVTSFFREAHHFDSLAEVMLKPALAKIRTGQRLRFWSAGCSAGQEPCSIAMQILDLLPEAPKLNIRILATDIDPAILARAREALYPDEEARTIPPGMRRSFTEPRPGNCFTPDARITGMIRYAGLNLVGDWPMRGPFDAIFCRNVAIYFDKATQARLWSRFATMLRPDGLLFIGHSERVSGPASGQLVSAGITTYRRALSTERTDA